MLRRLEIVDRRLCESVAEDARILLFITPDEAERRFLTDELGIDPHTLASASDPDELGRVEFEPGHAAIIFKRPKQYCADDNFFFKISSVGIFLFRERLVFVVAEDSLRFEGKHFQQINSLEELLLKVVFRCIWHFEEHLKVFNMIAEELEHKVNLSMENKHLLHMFTLEKSLVYYLNAISSNGRVIEKLKAFATRFRFTCDDVEFLDDITIENAQCHEMATTYSQVLASLVGARVSVVSNNLNVLMKRLMIVTIGLMLPTAVFSIFGMNVQLPIDESSGAFGFWIIIVLAILSGAAVFVLYRWKKL
ncbi:magnesium transporter CorA family protein [Luteolibacter flavescens]|uniref:magnesium transporter CorA family protein n=1 Tax=Luteolibacter flavescens TaxID=1859460 RepID=UPI0022215025|nr:magnesium transporter CorA family protein [Luteolibacter flavescens]